jgi:hypothetical protein
MIHLFIFCFSIAKFLFEYSFIFQI